MKKSMFGGRFMDLHLLQKRGQIRVYKATHVARGVEVLLKVARRATTEEQLISTMEAQRKLYLETLATDRVVHPNVVRVIDASFGPKTESYLATEYLDGKDLADYLDKQGRLSPLKAITVGIAVLRALCASHKKGVIHGDVKPSNIILLRGRHDDEDGIVLVDFGCASAADLCILRSESRASGTPGYMCPAYAATGLADERSDIFSLGITLYEAISGVNPIASDGRFQISDSSLNLRIRKRTPPKPLCQIVPTVSPQLSAAISRAIEHSPKLRYQSAREFLKALETLRDDLCQWDGSNYDSGLGNENPTAPFGVPMAMRALDNITASRDALIAGLASGSLEPLVKVLEPTGLSCLPEPNPNTDTMPDGLPSDLGIPGTPPGGLARMDCERTPTAFQRSMADWCPLTLDLDKTTTEHSPDHGAGESPTTGAASDVPAQEDEPSSQDACPPTLRYDSRSQADLSPSGREPRANAEEDTSGDPIPANSPQVASGVDDAGPRQSLPLESSPRDLGKPQALTPAADPIGEIDSGWSTPTGRLGLRPAVEPAAPNEPKTPKAKRAPDPASAIREALASEAPTPPTCVPILRALEADTPADDIYQAVTIQAIRAACVPSVAMFIAPATATGAIAQLPIEALPKPEGRSIALFAAWWAPSYAEGADSAAAHAQLPTAGDTPNRVLQRWSATAQMMVPRSRTVPLALPASGAVAPGAGLATPSSWPTAQPSTYIIPPASGGARAGSDTLPFGTLAASRQYIGGRTQVAAVLAPACETAPRAARTPKSGRFVMAQQAPSRSALRAAPAPEGQRPVRIIRPVESGRIQPSPSRDDGRRDSRVYGGVPIRRPVLVPPEAESAPFAAILKPDHRPEIVRGAAAACGGVACAAALLLGFVAMRPVALPGTGATTAPPEPLASSERDKSNSSGLHAERPLQVTATGKAPSRPGPSDTVSVAVASPAPPRRENADQPASRSASADPSPQTMPAPKPAPKPSSARPTVSAAPKAKPCAPGASECENPLPFHFVVDPRQAGAVLPTEETGIVDPWGPSAKAKGRGH